MNTIRLEIEIQKEIEAVWLFFTQPEHIINWKFAHPSWHCPIAKADLTIGGNFSYRMEAREGSEGFFLEGTFTEIIPNSKLRYQLADERKVEVVFTKINANTTKIVKTFEPEQVNELELQRNGWFAILENFKKYAESKNNN